MLQRALEPDVDAARRHVRLLTGEEDPVVCWQVFPDHGKERKGLAASFHGRLGDVLPQLSRAQRDGCGVFVSVNETDGKRRTKDRMIAARAVFLDLDGAPLPASWPVPPALITRTSASENVVKYHVWWLLEPTADFDLWERVEKALIARYGGDAKCALWTQVGRVAGFWHQKDRDNPGRVEIVEIREDTRRWPPAEFAARMQLDLDSVPVRPERDGAAIKEPVHGWDDDADVARARKFLAAESNWHQTSDGGVSVFKMACRLRDLSISPELAEELISEYLPVPPADSWRDDHIEQKVANAYRYASGDAGSASSVASQAAFDAVPLDEHDAEAAAAGADDDEAIALLELVERDDAALLYEGPNIALLARLKQTARDRYESLLVIWRKRRVEGLRELDKAVDRYIKAGSGGGEG